MRDYQQHCPIQNCQIVSSLTPKPIVTSPIRPNYPASSSSVTEGAADAASMTTAECLGNVNKFLLSNTKNKTDRIKLRMHLNPDREPTWEEMEERDDNNK